jgi:hypothetical protein
MFAANDWKPFQSCFNCPDRDRLEYEKAEGFRPQIILDFCWKTIFGIFFPMKTRSGASCECSDNLYNNLAKPSTTVVADPFYVQTSGPIPPRLFELFLKKYLKKLFV